MATKLWKAQTLQLMTLRRLTVHMPHDGVTHFPIVVLGGGSGGCSMASRLCRLMGHGDIAIVKAVLLIYSNAKITRIQGV